MTDAAHNFLPTPVSNECVCPPEYIQSAGDSPCLQNCATNLRGC